MAEAVVRLRVDASGATRALSGVQNQTNKLQSSFNGLRTAIAATGITLIGRQAVRTSANFDKLNVRLKLLTKSSKDFAKSQQIATDAQKAFGLSATEALEGVTDITARLAPLGSSIEEIRTVFFGFNTAAKLAGSSAQESSNAFRQLAQALGSGRLAGDEFRSVSEQVPTILAPIAEELGVTIGQLKQLAADGKLTSEVVLRALGRVGNEGSGFLKQLLANDPTQVFKNFSNATEDLSRAFGKELRPAVESVTKNLTALINKIVEFSGSDIGKTSILITKIAVSAKLLTVAATAATAAVAIIVGKLTSIGAAAIIAKGGFGAVATSSLLAAKGIGAVTLAAGALKVALLASGVGAFALVVGGLATAFFKAKREAQEFTDLLESGSQEDVTKAFEKQKKAVEALEKQLERTNSRRAGQIRQRLEDEQAELRLLENKLNTLAAEERITEEQKKQNEEKKKSAELIKKQQEEAEKLKEKFMEIGMSIEQGVVQNLTDAAMGTKSLGEAAISVLNDLKRKLIEVAMQQAVSGLGQFLGTALGSIFGGGIGGGGGGLGMTQGASLPSNPVGFSGYSRPTVRLGRGTAFRANGGPVSAGGSYIVGEKGPEMFTPSRSGTIIPNNAMGGVTNNISIVVDATGTAVEGNDAEANQFGEQLAAAIQAEIINQKRSGGLLN